MKESEQRFSTFLHRFIVIAGAVSLAFGLTMLLGTTGVDHLLIEQDRLFGITNRTLLWIAGALYLLLGASLLAPLDLGRRGLLMLWAGWCHLVYFAGMAWVKAATPLPIVQLVGWKIGANDPRMVGVLWEIFVGSLFIGGCSCLLCHRHQWRRADREASLEAWRRAREAAAERRTQPVNTGFLRSGRQSQGDRSNKPGDFKFSCPACGQHIQCERAYSGRQIPCPTCGRQIHVPEEKQPD